MNKKKLYLLGALTLFGFTLVSFLIHFFFSSDKFLTLFYSEQTIFFQLLLGTIVGWSISLVGWEITQLNCLINELKKYHNLFSASSLSLGVILFVSLSAGVGEEVFFRGILQPVFGIAITSVFFVAIHGYINPKNWKISIYGVYMTLGIILIGYLSEEVGLLTAISAHTVIDVVLLLKIRKALL